MSTDTTSTEVNWPNWERLFDQKPYVLLVSPQAQHGEFVQAIEQVLNELSGDVQAPQETTLADGHEGDAEHRNVRSAGSISLAIDAAALAASQPGQVQLSSQAIKALAQIAVKQALAEHAWKRPSDKKQNSTQESFDEWVHRARGQVLLVEQEQALDESLHNTVFEGNFMPVAPSVDMTQGVADPLPPTQEPPKGKVTLGELKVIDPPPPQNAEPLKQGPTQKTLPTGGEGGSGNSGSSGGEGQGGGRLQSAKPRLRLEVAEQPHHKPALPDMPKSPEHMQHKSAGHHAQLQGKQAVHHTASHSHTPKLAEADTKRHATHVEGGVSLARDSAGDRHNHPSHNNETKITSHQQERTGMNNTATDTASAKDIRNAYLKGQKNPLSDDEMKHVKYGLNEQTNTSRTVLIEHNGKIIRISDEILNAEPKSSELNLGTVDIKTLPKEEALKAAEHAGRIEAHIHKLHTEAKRQEEANAHAKAGAEIADRILHTQLKIPAMPDLTGLTQQQARQLGPIAEHVKNLPAHQQAAILDQVADTTNHQPSQETQVKPAQHEPNH